MAYDPHGQYQPPPRMYQMPRARTFPPEQQHLDPRRNDASASDHHQFNEHEPFNGHGRPYQTHPGRPAYEPARRYMRRTSPPNDNLGRSMPSPIDLTVNTIDTRGRVLGRTELRKPGVATTGIGLSLIVALRAGILMALDVTKRCLDTILIRRVSPGSSMPPAKAPSQQRPVQRRPASPELMSWDNPFPVFPGTKKKAPLGDKRSLEERMADTSIQQKSHAPDHLNGRSVHSSGSKSSQDSARSQRIPGIQLRRVPPRETALAVILGLPREMVLALILGLARETVLAFILGLARETVLALILGLPREMVLALILCPPRETVLTDARNHEWRGPHNGNPSDRYAVPGRDAPTAQYAPDRHARYETGNMTARPPARDDQMAPGHRQLCRRLIGLRYLLEPNRILLDTTKVKRTMHRITGQASERSIRISNLWANLEHGARQEEEGEEEMPNFDAVADHSSGHRRGMTIDQHVPQAKRMDRAPAPSIHPTNLQGSNEPAPATSGFADQAHRSRSQPDLRSQAGSGPGPGPIFEVAGDIPEMPSVPQMLPEMPGSDVPPDASRGVPSAGGRAGGYGGGYGGPRLQQQQTWPAQAPAPESHAYAQFDFDISSPSPAQYGPPHGFREPGHHGYGREERGYLDDRQASPRARPDLARPSLDSALARPPSPDGRPIHPDALSARPIHPDTLAAHPVPVRHGLAPTAAPPPQSKPPAPLRQYHHSSAPPGTQPTVNGAGVGAAAASSSAYGASSGVEPSGSRPPGRRPASSSTTTTASSSAPVTHAELDRLQAAAKAQPTNRKLQLQLGQKLAEAALVLADNDGRADPKTRNKAREKYVLEALKVVKKLVQAGYPDAMFYLADCYGTGRLGLEPDAKEAFALYQTAAKAGHAPSAYRTAVCWEMGPDGGGGTRREPQKAIQWYKRAAGLGDTPAMYKLGMIQLKGLLGQARNAGEAVAWLRRAAERADAENPHALHELALLYESGLDDIAPNEAHSIALFTRAAELGYKFSQFRLGSAHEYGLMGCAIDARRSIGWYSRAAAQAEHQSELALSGWYLTGADPVLHQSDTEAYLWARRAAHAGLPKAEYAMGYFTEVGIGAPPNVEEAKRWYRKAAAQNFPNARERLHDFQKGGATVQSRERISRSKVGKQHEGECCVM
ncbi:MAG: hypothetical protein M1826_003413 [Phylliscum demangeonii]|nr:MAG: hypothetical protein M1826_003413 [Phylliscum demangeonii]